MPEHISGQFHRRRDNRHDGPKPRNIESRQYATAATHTSCSGFRIKAWIGTCIETWINTGIEAKLGTWVKAELHSTGTRCDGSHPRRIRKPDNDISQVSGIGLANSVGNGASSFSSCPCTYVTTERWKSLPGFAGGCASDREGKEIDGRSSRIGSES
jgi:hypothetical protein